MFDPIAIHLGPLAIRWYALCIVTGLILAVYLTMKEAPRKKIIPDDILDFILIAFPLAILGARLYYVIFRFDYYSQNLGEIFAIWNGGLAIYGGLITGAIVLYIFADRKLINTWDFLDIAAPSVMIAQSLGRWGSPYRSWYFYHSISKSKEGPLLYFRGGKLNVRSCIYSCSPCFDCIFSVFNHYCTKAWTCY